MPIDPSIILNARAPQIQTQMVDPLQRASQVLNLQGAMGNQQMEALKLKQAQQAMAEDEQAKEAFRGGGSESEILQRLMGISPKTGMAYGKQLQEGRKTEAEIGSKESETRKRQYDIQIDKWQRAASILSTAKDQDSYTAAVRMIALDVDPQLIAGAPQQFNPQFVQQAMAKGQTIVQRLADQRAREGQAITMRGQDIGAETSRRGQDIGAQTAREGHGVTMRGQNLVDARTRERLAAEQTNLKNQFSAPVEVTGPDGRPRLVMQNKSTGEMVDANTRQVVSGFGPKMGETAQKQLTGVGTTKDAIQEYRNALKNFSLIDLAKPSAVARMGTIYNNMLLQAKEAYSLGVLNGPDYMILQQVITSPASLRGAVTSKGGLDAQAQKLDEIMSRVGQRVTQTQSGIVGQEPQQTQPTPGGDYSRLWK